MGGEVNQKRVSEDPVALALRRVVGVEQLAVHATRCREATQREERWRELAELTAQAGGEERHVERRTAGLRACSRRALWRDVLHEPGELTLEGVLSAERWARRTADEIAGVNR